MTARKSLEIRFPESDITRKELEEIERTEERRKDRPKALALKELNVAPGVFQWRLDDEDRWTREQHVKDLIMAIRSGDDMEPLLVVPIGSRFFVVDGHHRLAAFTSIGWKRKVPVRVRELSLAEAEIAALEGNNQSKLPLTKEARTEASWRLTKQWKPEGGYVFSKAETAKKAGVGRSLVRIQREALEELGNRAAAMSWSEVLRHRRNIDDDEDRFGDTWRQEKAQEIAEAIMRAAGGVDLGRNPDIMAMAIQRISRGLVSGVVQYLGEAADPEDLEALDI